MKRLFLAAIAALFAGTAFAAYIAPEDFAVFPPRHAQRFFIETDCSNGGVSTAGGGSGWISSIAGTGAAIQGPTTNVLNNWSGLCQINTGTTTTGRVALHTNVIAFDLASGRAKFFAAFDEGTVSDGTNTYSLRVGFLDNVTGSEPTDGCYFRYTHGTNSGKWEIVARSNGSETAQDSGVTFTATTRRTFGISAITGGCAFYNAGAQVSTTIATNVPTGNTRVMGAGIAFIKSAGTTDIVPIYVDYIAVEQRPTTARGWAAVP